VPCQSGLLFAERRTVEKKVTKKTLSVQLSSGKFLLALTVAEK
jgi:hypothetical protein